MCCCRGTQGMLMDTQTLNAEYWNVRHGSGDTPWDIGQASPALQAWYRSHSDKTARVLIPGAGHAHEVVSLLNEGFSDITVCDISSIAVEQIRRQFAADQRVKVLLCDFFELSESYDLILEQTFFCAIDPKLRETYVEKMASLLSDHGLLVGVLFATPFEKAGPPFGGTKEEYMSLFSKNLHIIRMDMCENSIPQRQGNELFFVCEKQKSS